MLILFAKISDLSHSKVDDEQLIDLSFTVVIDDDVAGFDVPMEDAILPAFDKLRDIVLLFILLLFLLSNEVSPELVGVIFIYLIVQEV